MLVVLALGLSAAGRPIERMALLSTLLWLTVRAPVGQALGLEPLFSPGTFFRPLLGPLSGSAGVLSLTAILLTVGGVGLWRRRLPRRWYGLALGGALLLISPYLISSLGRGITPPADGVSIGLWLIWHLALLVSASALIVPTAALFRGREADGRALVAHRPRGGDRAGGIGHRGAGLESPRRVAGLVHLPVDAGAAPRHAAGAALGRHHRHRPGGGELLRAGDLGRGAGRKGAGGATRRCPPGQRARPACGAAAGALRRRAPPRPRAGNRLGDVRIVARVGAGVPGLPGASRAVVRPTGR